jgi:hypothetical protein
MMDNNIWIDRHEMIIGKFMSMLKDDDDLIVYDVKYNIPSVISHISPENLNILSSFYILNIYGVCDETGKIHLNEMDVETIKNWINNLEGRDLRLTLAKKINLITIDYKSSDDYKHNFWNEVLK